MTAVTSTMATTAMSQGHTSMRKPANVVVYDSQNDCPGTDESPQRPTPNTPHRPCSHQVSVTNARPEVRVMPAPPGEVTPAPGVVRMSPYRLKPPSLVSTCPTIQAPSVVDSQPMSAAGSVGTPTRPNGVDPSHSSSAEVSRSAVSGSM